MALRTKWCNILKDSAWLKMQISINKNYHVHEIPTGDQLLLPHYSSGFYDHRIFAIGGFAPSLSLSRTEYIAPDEKGTDLE